MDDHTKNETIFDCLFIIMAIDNKREKILDYITENVNNTLCLDLLIKYGANHEQFNARWQIAELIRRRPTEQGIKVLIYLKQDINEYVRRRAINSLNDIIIQQ